MSIHTRGLHPEVRQRAEWALSVAQRFRVPVTVTSAYRSLADQRRLRAKWERGESRYPANRPGDSAHNFGLAWDSVTDARYQPWWNYVRELIGFRVPPNDEIHAEVPGWRQYV